ncbi:hypothetical protein SLE2022_214840 [Rubroshorea leprosula]
MSLARIGALIRSLARYSLQKGASFSSYAVPNPRFSNSLFDGTEEGSAVYQTKLKTQRPTTIKRWSRPDNSVSFIGTVVWPLSVHRTNNGRLAVKTLLNVKNPRESNSTLSINLVMREEMAEMCIQHLKQNDFIYVSGHLQTYTKPVEDGKLGIYYQVDVKELNYVKHHGQRAASEKSKDLEIQGGEDRIEKYRNKLHLWQVFLHNPSEWWDNRKNKRSPQQPDFKHKDTGESLWLSPNDPPWVKRQLELLDSRMGEGLGKQVRSHSRVSTWVYDE